MAKGSYYVEETWSKYIFHITLPDGTTREISGRNYDELLAQTKRLISQMGMGHPKGQKNFKGRQYNEKDIKRIFGRVDLAVSGAAFAGTVKTMDEIARKLLSSALNLRNGMSNIPNIYSGNLQRSYVASIIHNKNVKKRITEKSSRRGNIYHTENGARYAELTEKHHPVAGFVYYNKKRGARYKNGPKYLMKNGKIIRYLRHWEKEKGYLENATVGYRNWSRLNLGETQPHNKGGIRSAIVIENTAPYADAVQRAHFRVLQNAMAENVVGDATLKQRQLIRVVTKRMLKEAGFDIQ